MIAIGIVAHTTRAKQATELAAHVQADFLHVDDGTLGCEGNHRSVLQQLAHEPSTWTTVLEDDAVPIDGFHNQLAAAVLMSPTPIVSLYLGQQRPPWAQAGIRAAITEAEHTNADWIIGSNLLHAVGYAIRTNLIPSLLKFPPSPLPIDQHITRWAITYGHAISYTWPSLVDHADTPTVISQHPDGQPRTPGRLAWKTGPRTTRAVTMKV